MGDAFAGDHDLLDHLEIFLGALAYLDQLVLEQVGGEAGLVRRPGRERGAAVYPAVVAEPLEEFERAYAELLGSRGDADRAVGNGQALQGFNLGRLLLDNLVQRGVLLGLIGGELESFGEVGRQRHGVSRHLF